MKTTPVTLEDLRGVFPVPPLARKTDAKRSLDFEQNKLLLRYFPFYRSKVTIYKPGSYSSVLCFVNRSIEK